MLLKTPAIRRAEETFGADLPDVLVLLYSRHRGTKAVAAALGVTPTTLRAWMRRMGAEENADGTLKLNARIPASEVRVVE
jgi:hypothetical protein